MSKIRVAEDNPNERNGLYTKHLKDALPTPNPDLRAVFRSSSRRSLSCVQPAAESRTYDGIVGRLILNAAGSAPPPAPVDTSEAVRAGYSFRREVGKTVRTGSAATILC